MPSYEPKNEQTALQALKVQELCVRGSDHAVLTVSGGNSFVIVREPVDAIYHVQVKVDATNLNSEFAQANLSVVDSVAFTPGGDYGAIKITGLAAVAAADCITVKYTIQE